MGLSLKHTLRFCVLLYIVFTIHNVNGKSGHTASGGGGGGGGGSGGGGKNGGKNTNPHSINVVTNNNGPDDANINISPYLNNTSLDDGLGQASNKTLHLIAIKMHN